MSKFVTNIHHMRRVQALYKKTLKTLKDCLATRQFFVEEAGRIREEFEEHRNETDPGKIEFLIERAEYWIWALKDSSPYIHIDHPGGTSWLRNYFPPEFCRDPEEYNFERNFIHEDLEEKKEENKDVHH